MRASGEPAHAREMERERQRERGSFLSSASRLPEPSSESEPEIRRP